MPGTPARPHGLVLTLTPPAEDLSTVRAWARSRGFPVDEAGDVPAVVLHTYRQVHRAGLRLSA